MRHIVVAAITKAVECKFGVFKRGNLVQPREPACPAAVLTGRSRYEANRYSQGLAQGMGHVGRGVLGSIARGVLGPLHRTR